MTVEKGREERWTLVILYSSLSLYVLEWEYIYVLLMNLFFNYYFELEPTTEIENTSQPWNPNVFTRVYSHVKWGPIALACIA